jgi:hypothetical protein
VFQNLRNFLMAGETQLAGETQHRSSTRMLLAGIQFCHLRDLRPLAPRQKHAGVTCRWLSCKSRKPRALERAVLATPIEKIRIYMVTEELAKWSATQ